MTDVDALKVARHMFDRNATDLGANETEKTEAWNDAEVRKFWTEQAESVLSFIGFAGP